MAFTQAFQVGKIDPRGSSRQCALASVMQVPKASPRPVESASSPSIHLSALSWRTAMPPSACSVGKGWRGMIETNAFLLRRV